MAFLCIEYIDESGTAGPLMAVTACIGSVRKWDTFEKRWRLMLNREMAGVPPEQRFWHMLSYQRGKDQYDGWDKAKRGRVYAEARGLVTNAVFYSGTASVLTADYKALHRRYPGLLSIYAFLTSRAIHLVSDYLDRERPDAKLVYRIESGARGEDQVARHMEAIARDSEKVDAYRLVDWSLADKKQFPGLQAADVVAFETRRYLEIDILGSQGQPRRALMTLPRKSWQIIHYDRASLEKMARHYFPGRVVRRNVR
jgi:uncharacterized protein DUF3800